MALLFCFGTLLSLESKVRYDFHVEKNYCWFSPTMSDFWRHNISNPLTTRGRPRFPDKNRPEVDQGQFLQVFVILKSTLSCPLPIFAWSWIDLESSISQHLTANMLSMRCPCSITLTDFGQSRLAALDPARFWSIFAGFSLFSIFSLFFSSFPLFFFFFFPLFSSFLRITNLFPFFLQSSQATAVTSLSIFFPSSHLSNIVITKRRRYCEGEIFSALAAASVAFLKIFFSSKSVFLSVHFQFFFFFFFESLILIIQQKKTNQCKQLFSQRGWTLGWVGGNSGSLSSPARKPSHASSGQNPSPTMEEKKIVTMIGLRNWIENAPIEKPAQMGKPLWWPPPQPWPVPWSAATNQVSFSAGASSWFHPISIFFLFFFPFFFPCLTIFHKNVTTFSTTPTWLVAGFWKFERDLRSCLWRSICDVPSILLSSFGIWSTKIWKGKISTLELI